eukprot:m.257444 g.257444  ORF g.257444 m.257444 type:complete len:135 (+) comp40409_c0_seq24:1180-1584(+)
MKLPCRHILAVRKAVAMDVYVPDLCATRWYLSYFIKNHYAYKCDTLCDDCMTTESGFRMEVVNKEEDHRQALSEQDKFRQGMKLFQESAMHLSTEDFLFNLQILREQSKLLREDGNESKSDEEDLNHGQKVFQL